MLPLLKHAGLFSVALLKITKKPNVQQLNGCVIFEGMSVQLVFFIFLFCWFVLQSATRQLRLAVRRFPV